MFMALSFQEHKLIFTFYFIIKVTIVVNIRFEGCSYKNISKVLFKVTIMCQNWIIANTAKCYTKLLLIFLKWFYFINTSCKVMKSLTRNLSTNLAAIKICKPYVTRVLESFKWNNFRKGSISIRSKGSIGTLL